MTDEQFNQIMKVLKQIELNTSMAASDISSIYTNVNTVNDLDSIHTKLSELARMLKGN